MHGPRLHIAEPRRRRGLCVDQSAAAYMSAETLNAVVLPEKEDVGEPPWRRALARLVKRRAAVAGLVVVLFFVVLAVAAPFVSPYDPLATSWATVRKAPSAAH